MAARVARPTAAPAVRAAAVLAVKSMVVQSLPEDAMQTTDGQNPDLSGLPPPAMLTATVVNRREPCSSWSGQRRRSTETQ